MQKMKSSSSIPKLLKVALIVLLAVLVSACTPSANGKRSSKSSSNATDTKNPENPIFPNSSSYIQVGNEILTSAVTLDINYADFFQLRGKQIHEYLKASGTSDAACLISRFSDNNINKIIISAALPRSYYNFTSKSLEYYYSVSPNNPTTNKSFCQKTTLLNLISNLYPAYQIDYSLSILCDSTNCLYQNFTGQRMKLYTSSANEISQISVDNLYYNITNYNTPPTGNNNSCTSTAQCTAIGFDCCSGGICVNDLTLKAGVDENSTDYLQALQDILNNPNKIYNYPNYYNICSQPVVPPTTPTEPSDPEADAVRRVENLANLHSCTNKVLGELGVCAITHKNLEVGKTYNTPIDDRSFNFTFSNTAHPHLSQYMLSIEEVFIGEVSVFNVTKLDANELMANEYANEFIKISAHHNDDFSTGAVVTFLKQPPSATRNEMIIKYRNDASCVKLNSNLIRCEKYYTQDLNSNDNSIYSLLFNKSLMEKNRSYILDHYIATNNFNIPAFANLDMNISVEVDGIVQKRSTDWDLVVGYPSYIQFISNNQNLKVSRGQEVKITYFVTGSSNIMLSKNSAQTQINSLCSCTNGIECSIAPVKDSEGVIKDYACVYPTPPAEEPPMSQKFYMSSKTVPVRFFDQTGASKKKVGDSIYKQEGTKEFFYRNNNLLNPNNVADITDTTGASAQEDHYVGFHEIYGSLNTLNNAAKPAMEISVKKETSYDIYVDGGTLSNCVNCGSDYYSALTKLFPLTQFGSGVDPILGQTNRVATTVGSVRSDDLKFGRACLVPATMIPWTHAIKNSQQSQRLARMDAQHFMYANGYQYDWYGFDYGSVIGSFDGVKWFSIGTNRRIKATTNKLFLAVNAPFGDQSIESTFTVSINEESLNPFGENLITSDEKSDGAQCQQFHQCSTDNDCASTLGWEYSCATVSEISTPWPVFDANANELAGTQAANKKLISILGTNAGHSAKRCVYRGRGALCSQNYNSVSANNYIDSQNNSFHACSSANYCQNIYENGSANNKFNDRIARFARPQTTTTKDKFGLAAQIIGRPFDFHGSKSANPTVLTNLINNKVTSMCIPGKNIDGASFTQQDSVEPINANFKGDRVLNIGMTHVSNATVSPAYLSSCSVLDQNSNYFYKSPTATPASIKTKAASQVISSNALGVFKNILIAKDSDLSIYKNNNTVLTAISLTENRCLRAPGASCFSDLDCAPSKTIADKIKAINSEDLSLSSILNKYEIKFWQEELICSQAIKSNSTDYDPRNNRCCRDVGKVISVATANPTNNLNYRTVAGVDIPYNSQNRYSRASTMYDKTINSPSDFPELRSGSTNACGTGACFDKSAFRFDKQFNTLSGLNQLTSCTGHWIRNFDSGNHKWEKSRFQTIAPSNFRCYNWKPVPADNNSNLEGYEYDDGTYSCANFEKGSPNCPAVQTSTLTNKGKDILNYFGRLELTGIPQITLEAKSNYTDSVAQSLSCQSDPGGRAITYPNLAAAEKHKTPDIFAAGINDLVSAEYQLGVGGKLFYSASDITNFKTGTKKIFKEDEFATCHPAGTKMEVNADPNLCCTGNINPETQRCQLPDYVDVSVYTNRYVSSEAQTLGAGLFDEYGFIKDLSNLAYMACEKRICASGAMAKGVLISNLQIPGQDADNAEKIFRFLEGNTTADNKNGLLDLYNNGLRYNTHLYCIPATLAQDTNAANDLSIFKCE